MTFKRDVICHPERSEDLNPSQGGWVTACGGFAALRMTGRAA